MLAACAPSAAQIWRVKAATEVLPLVPVTAAMACGWCGKNRAAASASARRALATCMKAMPAGSGAGHALRHHRGRAGGNRLRHKAQAVVLGACHRDKQVARFDRAAVGADAGEIERREARIADGSRR